MSTFDNNFYFMVYVFLKFLIFYLHGCYCNILRIHFLFLTCSFFSLLFSAVLYSPQPKFLPVVTLPALFRCPSDLSLFSLRHPPLNFGSLYPWGVTNGASVVYIHSLVSCVVNSSSQQLLQTSRQTVVSPTKSSEFSSIGRLR